MSFGIKDGNFMMLKDSTLNFLHGYWNYFLMKIDIDVRRFYTQFSEGFFDRADVVAEAMATATLAPA